MNLKQVVRAHVVQVKKSDTEPASKDPATKINVDLARALKRDFKIFGIVGGGRQKDCLSFVSLFRQAGVKAVLPRVRNRGSCYPSSQSKFKTSIISRNDGQVVTDSVKANSKSPF